jgi:transposase-like protein
VGQFVLSKSTVSELTDTLNQEHEAFRTRDLRGYNVASLLIDAVYEPLRRWGSKTGGLCVWAICVDGRKVLLSLSTANSESQESCLEVLRDLLKRGSPDASEHDHRWRGGVDQSDCCDLAQVPAPSLLVAQDTDPAAESAAPSLARVQGPVVDRREAPTVAEAERRRQAIVAESHLDFPEACRCLLDDAKASLTHLSVPPRHQPYVRPANLAERAFEEQRRRTKVIPPWWDEGGLVTLVFAVLLRVSERWGTKGCSEFEQQQIRSLRRKLELDEHQVSISDPKPDSHPRRSAASAA